tara:strand:+ start:423 stop:1307 length:885 start_codon:yes stop_codon:yes gene_type:complete
MKIAQPRLKEIIKEEIISDERIVNAIKDLSSDLKNDSLDRAIDTLIDKIEGLDVSVDFLSAAVLDVDPLSISGAQSALGRSANPTGGTKFSPSTPETPPEVEEIIRQELETVLGEETEKALNEAEPVVKMPVSKMNEFKRRLEKWAMHYEKISSWIANDAILAPDDEQLENPRQLSRITREEGMRMRRTLYKLDNTLMQLMQDFDMTFKSYEDERYKALKTLDLDETSGYYQEPEELEEKDDWIQKAVDPDHEGYCTPMTKPTCTPKRKALAKRFKKAAKKKDKDGGTGWQGKV